MASIFGIRNIPESRSFVNFGPSSYKPGFEQTYNSQSLLIEEGPPYTLLIIGVTKGKDLNFC